jgi:uncharacterized membrane protein YfcA
VTFWEAMLLLGGGLAAGVINTMAGGGSALTVPLLVLAGVPGNQANGSNRVGVLTASAAAVAVPMMPPRCAAPPKRSEPMSAAAR